MPPQYGAACAPRFDILENPTAQANCSRLPKADEADARDLGWSPIKARGLTPGGFKDQVRGYARDKDPVML
jgi:hypothetical protein